MINFDNLYRIPYELNEMGDTERGQALLNNIARSKRHDEFLRREKANSEQDLANRVSIEKAYGIDSRNDSVAKEVHAVRDLQGRHKGFLSTRMATNRREDYPPNHPESHQGQANKWRNSADRARDAANKFESYMDRARERHGDLDPERKEKDEKTFKNWQGTKVMAQHKSHLASDLGKGDFRTKRL